MCFINHRWPEEPEAEQALGLVSSGELHTSIFSLCQWFISMDFYRWYMRKFLFCVCNRSVIVKFRFIYHWKLNRGFNFIC